MAKSPYHPHLSVEYPDIAGDNRISYAYDALGQLNRVNDPFDPTGTQGTTWVYTYDLGGNILSKTAYPFTEAETIAEAAVHTDTYTYGEPNWKDQLTAYNGVQIRYDGIGNPEDDGEWIYTWQHGRQLAQMSKDGETVSFVYNEDGLRVQKTATSTGTTKYILHGKNIVHLTNGQNELHFFYDAQGKAAAVEYNGTSYRYLHNLQGDVIALIDGNGNRVVEYSYDAWGKPIQKTGTMADTLGTLQPFRYRGYVWDEETGLYYLRSRYYRPEWCRFVNTDSHLGFRGEVFAHNVYTYCANSPGYLVDSDGLVWTMGAYEPYYGYYHAEVQKWITSHNGGIVMEATTSTSRIDLYNVYSTEIYEVKPDTPEHIEAGKVQLKRYLRGILPTKLGDACRLILPKDGTLHYEYTNVVVDISVRAEGSLILYTPKQTYKRKRQTVPAPAVIPARERAYNEKYAIQPGWTKVFGVAVLLLGLLTPIPGDEAIGFGLLMVP